MVNFETKLRAFLTGRPFRPFVVELAGGTKVVVDHPETLLVRGGTAVHLDRRGRPSIFDEEAVVRVRRRREPARSR